MTNATEKIKRPKKAPPLPGYLARLLRWYASQQREMPWRTDPTPYKVWISEVMLQQTQVDTVRPYFARFLKRAPDVAALAALDEDTLLKLWEGLGYYSRARHLQQAARRIVGELGGELPRTFEAWRALPGIGPYSAAAIVSIAYGLPEPLVDGNVLRVWARFRASYDDIKTPQTRARFLAELRPLIQLCDPACFNQALMELGALVCRPRHPSCADCPLSAACEARRQGLVEELPQKTPRPKVPHYDVVVGLLQRDGRVLIAKRPSAALLGGLWEFPGGKRAEGESPAAALCREVREECALTIQVGPELITLRHAYSHFSITLTAFLCTVTSGRERPLASQELRWVLPAELACYPFPKANQRVLAAFTQSLAKTEAPG